YMPHPCHLTNTGQLYNSNPIILNSTEHVQGECGGGTLDQIDKGKTCVPIPDDEIIYICRANCYDTPTSERQRLLSSCQEAVPIDQISSYGDDKTVYDVYFRLSDYPTPGVPDPIANCGPYVTQTA